MARISFTDTRTGQLSWFDPDAAQAEIGEGRNWNGNNWIGACSGLQTSQAVLYLTKGGRWLENVDARHEFNGSDEYRFLTDDQAQQWLIKAADAGRDTEGAEAALQKYFPDTPEESGPDLRGRPEIGPKVETRISAETLAKVDARAAKEGVARAEVLRRIIEAGV